MAGTILTVAGFEGMQLVFTGALALGLVMAFFPAIAQRYMRRITGNDDIAFGHFGTLGYVLSGWIGSLALKGYFPREQLLTLNQNGTRLPSHPDRLLTCGVDATTGSLGQGEALS